VKITQVQNGPLVSEAWQQVAPYISQIIRLRAGSVGIEFEYTVGPIDVSDNRGKEIIMRFNSTIASNATWYTDSNGREFQTRIRDYRPTWKLDVTQPTAGNYYPINSAAYLKDSENAMVILNDRSQGCSSLVDGSMEVMVHRRLLHDDGRGVGEPLSEPGLDGKGLIITGHLIVAIVPQESAATVARRAQPIIYNPYHISYAALNGSVADYTKSHVTAVSYVNKQLPLNVELLTLQFWDQDTVLVRLAHSFAVGEDSSYSKPVTVDLNTLFIKPFSSIAEYTLSAAMPVGTRQKMTWNTVDNVQPQGARSSLTGSQVTLNPMEIKTFLCTM
jgi:lysosomal alpha-mannosidase